MPVDGMTTQGDTQRVSNLSKMSWRRNTQRVRAA